MGTGIQVTLVSAGALGLIYFVLSANVVRMRAATKVMNGDGAEREETRKLHTAIRAHGNFAEYVPLILILLGGIESLGASHNLVLGLASALVIGRILHPIGMGMKPPNVFRAGGVLLTWAVLVIASVTLLIHVF